MIISLQFRRFHWEPLRRVTLVPPLPVFLPVHDRPAVQRPVRVVRPLLQVYVYLPTCPRAVLQFTVHLCPCLLTRFCACHPGSRWLQNRLQVFPTRCTRPLVHLYR